MGAARQLVEEAVRHYNAGSVRELLSTYTEDAVEILPNGTFTGRQAIGERLQDHFRAFPGTQMRPVRWVEDGDTVVLEYEWLATHAGPLRLPDGSELAPTGVQVTVPVVSLFRVVDGKGVEHRLYLDQLPLMMQIGPVAPAG